MEIREDFLYFVWQFLHFNRSDLRTTDGEILQIIRPGVRNTHSGPDFAQARIYLGGIEWAGSVEIHVRASDWNIHQHQQDKAYDNVVLHVVWVYDQPIYRSNHTLIPALELCSRVDPGLLLRYASLMAAKNPILCEPQLREVAEIHKIQALDGALMQRLSHKANMVRELLQTNRNDWEETAYQLLARNFGFKINSEPFFRLAKAVPLKILQKHGNNLLQVEALLFGQAGFLDSSDTDFYGKQLQQEYSFLSHKYQLSDRKLSPQEWKSARLRPANFPALRIAQFAALVQQRKSLFSSLTEADSIAGVMNWMNVQTSGYWQTHYMFGRATSAVCSLGKSSRENILINTVIPLLMGYAEEAGNRAYQERAMRWLEDLPAEDNARIRQWREAGLTIRNAHDAQAGLELFNHFCAVRKCLTCAIGVSLIRMPAS